MDAEMPTRKIGKVLPRLATPLGRRHLPQYRTVKSTHIRRARVRRWLGVGLD